MKILIYGLNFPPEITGVGKYTGEMAAYLGQNSCEVKVVTSYPYYPAWKIEAGYNRFKYSREIWPLAGNDVQIIRCPLYVPSRPTTLKRILHLFSFAISSMPVILSQVFWKPDLLLCVAPTILCAPAALLTSFLAGAKSWLHIQDFEIQAAWSLGFLKEKNLLRRFIKNAFTKIIFWFDRVSTISENMVNVLKTEGVSEAKIYLFPNWVDISTIQFTEKTDAFRKELELDRGKTIVLFSGSMTKKQDLKTVIEAARILGRNKTIQFVLCGEGASREELEAEASDLPNVRFLPLQPIEKLNHVLNAADIHLLPQAATAADLVMPSKISAILASGRPVIAAVEENTAVSELVRGAGMITPPEDPISMANAIEYLATHSEIRAQMGAAARMTAEEQLAAAKILSNFYQSLVHFLSVEGSPG